MNRREFLQLLGIGTAAITFPGCVSVLGKEEAVEVAAETVAESLSTNPISGDIILMHDTVGYVQIPTHGKQISMYELYHWLAENIPPELGQVMDAITPFYYTLEHDWHIPEESVMHLKDGGLFEKKTGIQYVGIYAYGQIEDIDQMYIVSDGQTYQFKGRQAIAPVAQYQFEARRVPASDFEVREYEPMNLSEVTGLELHDMKGMLKVPAITPKMMLYA